MLDEIEIRCKNCGWHSSISFQEIRDINRNGKFSCSYCESPFYKLEQPCLVNMRQKVPTLEREMRYILLNSFISKGIDVWDCQGEYGKCPDPIKINGIPMRISIGDVPFLWNENFYIIELKLSILRCNKEGGAQIYTDRRETVKIRSGQWKLLLKDKGILLIMAEPKPFQKKGSRISGKMKPDCEKLLNTVYRKQIANNEIPYEIYILNSNLFRLTWEKFLREKKPERKFVQGRVELFKSISLKKLENHIPEAKLQMTWSSILDGNLVDVILNRLK